MERTRSRRSASKRASRAPRSRRRSSARCAATGDRVALRTRGGEREITWAEYGEPRRPVRSRPARASGLGAADVVALMLDEPARVPHRRHRRDQPRRDAVLALPDADARADRLPADRLRRPRSSSPSRRSSNACWRPGQLRPRLEHVVVVDDRPTGPTASSVRRAARKRGRPGEIRARRASGPAGRPPDADLHVRHHGPAEGRADHPRQHHERGRGARRGDRLPRGRARRLVPADGAHRRAGHRPLPADRARPHGHLLPEPARGDRLPAGGAPDLVLRGSADLGEAEGRHGGDDRGRAGRRSASGRCSGRSTSGTRRSASSRRASTVPAELAAEYEKADEQVLSKHPRAARPRRARGGLRGRCADAAVGARVLPRDRRARWPSCGGSPRAPAAAP